MSKNKRGIFPIFALLYLVSVVFFFWGLAAGNYKIFPWNYIAAVYEELHEYFTFDVGTDHSAKDKIILDHQERKNKYKFAGLRFNDENFHDDGYLLVSRYSKTHKQVIVDLLSLNTNTVLHTWIPPINKIFESASIFREDAGKRHAFRALHPFLLEDGSLVFTCGNGPMVKINYCGEIVWIIDRWFHHSIEIDHKGNIVANTVIEDEGKGFQAVLPIKDDGFAIVSPDGIILKEYSIADILYNNGYMGLLYGVGQYEKDRIHLNDAQPVYKNSESAKIGDILLSIRNLSSVALFNPNSEKIEWLKTGPWLNQHDINQLEDGKYSILGNDIIRVTKNKYKLIDEEKSDVYIFDEISGTVSQPFSEIMRSENVITKTQGRLDILDNGDAVLEESNSGRVLRFSEHNVRWEYVNAISPDTIGVLHWSRYIPKKEIDLEWIKKVSCN